MRLRLGCRPGDRCSCASSPSFTSRTAAASAVRLLRESGIHREAPSDLQVGEVVGVDAPYCRGTGRDAARVGTAPAVRVGVEAEAIQPRRRTPSKLCL